DLDPYNSLGTQAWPPSAPIGAAGTTYPTYNTQVDNSNANAYNINNGPTILGGTDVRLTQLRNILAGSRPFTNPLTPLPPLSATPADVNTVFGLWGTGPQKPYSLPNGIVDGADLTAGYTIADPSSGNILAQRTMPPVAGRWGEAPSIPGVPFNNPTGG